MLSFLPDRVVGAEVAVHVVHGDVIGEVVTHGCGVSGAGDLRREVRRVFDWVRAGAATTRERRGRNQSRDREQRRDDCCGCLREFEHINAFLRRDLCGPPGRAVRAVWERPRLLGGSVAFNLKEGLGQPLVFLATVSAAAVSISPPASAASAAGIRPCPYASALTAPITAVPEFGPPTTLTK